jgi:LmbE family N-acetylglucosaminyl deacetylase
VTASAGDPSDDAPARALAIGAHPDDIEFGCGATLAKWARAGAHIDLLVLTDGSKGTWDPDADLAVLVATRRAEQRAAASALGAHDVRFLEAVDGDLEADVARREEVCAVIRAVRPDVVLGHDPWKQYRLHPDHRHAGQLVIDGIVAARDPHFFPTAGAAHRPSRLLLFEAQVVDHVEQVDQRDVDAKVEALLCHRSQWRSTMGIDVESAEADAQGAAFRRSVEVEIAEAGGEPFKLLTDL